MRSILNSAHLPQHWLIECSLTIMCPTQTRDLLLFDKELVVISDLFCGLNVSLGVDDCPILVYYSTYKVLLGLPLWHWQNLARVQYLFKINWLDPRAWCASETFKSPNPFWPVFGSLKLKSFLRCSLIWGTILWIP